MYEKKISKRIICSLAILLIPFILFAQYDNPKGKNWAFPKYGGMSFITGNPAPFTTSMYNSATFEKPCVSVTDDEGLLLFYTDGATLWDRMGNVMPHGVSFNGDVQNRVLNRFQGVVIVPFINSPNLYYVFTLGKTVTTLICNVVNMNLNSGYGDVDSANIYNGVSLDSNLTSRMIAIAGCNNNIWLLNQKVGSGGMYGIVSREITANGISTSPVFTQTFTNQVVDGVMKVSPKRDKILIDGQNPRFINFNPNTGIVSNETYIEYAFTAQYLGGAISQDGSKAYLSKEEHIYQFDLNATNISATKTLIGATQPGDFKLASNGKIYFGGAVLSGSSHYLGCINYPNNAGAACGYQDTVTTTYMPTGIFSYGLPNEVWSPVEMPTFSQIVFDTTICNGSVAQPLHAASGKYQYLWEDGSTNPNRSITQYGIYWVKYKDSICNNYVDTYKVNGGPMPTVSIVQNNNYLTTTNTFATYQWYKDAALIPGATNQNVLISGNGIYSVAVSNGLGCYDSTFIQVSNNTAIENIITLAEKITVFPNPASSYIEIKSPVTVNATLYQIDGRALRSFQNAQYIHLSALKKGIYFLKITTTEGQFIKAEKIYIQ